MNPEDLSTALERMVRRRNLREAAVGLLMIAVFGGIAAFASEPLLRSGAVLVVLGVVAVLTVLWRRGVPAPRFGDPTAWLRSELARERDLLGTVLRWYLAPLVPGIVVLLVSRYLSAEGLAGCLAVAGVGAAVLVTFVVVARANATAARCLQANLDALDRA